MNPGSAQYGEKREIRTCSKTCNFYFWTFGSWSECKLDGGNCGKGNLNWTFKRWRNVIVFDDFCCIGLGIQTRTVQCSTNGSPSNVKDTSLCESQSLIALDDLVSRDCYVACPDECVVESWSEWSECDRDCSEQRKRTRRVLRQDKNLQCNDTELIQVWI